MLGPDPLWIRIQGNKTIRHTLMKVLLLLPPLLFTFSLYIYCSLEYPCPFHRDWDPYVFKWKNGQGKTPSISAGGLQFNPEIRVTVKQF